MCITHRNVTMTEQTMVIRVNKNEKKPTMTVQLLSPVLPNQADRQGAGQYSRTQIPKNERRFHKNGYMSSADDTTAA